VLGGLDQQGDRPGRGCGVSAEAACAFHKPGSLTSFLSRWFPRKRSPLITEQLSHDLFVGPRSGTCGSRQRAIAMAAEAAAGAR
jgi:hypothetical protein